MTTTRTRAIAFVIGSFLLAAAPMPVVGQTVLQDDDFLDFRPGRMVIGSEWVQSIKVTAPELRSDVSGDVRVEFQAPGMTVARALCWQQPTKEAPNPLGHDTKVLPDDIKLDADGKGFFVFPADKYPSGPITVRILANNADMSKRDLFELQLFNKGGVVWNQGIPKTDPPAAAGMHLLFADDFAGPLSISSDGHGAKYSAHTPWNGDFSGWQFADPTGKLNPFLQVGTYLRIRGSKQPDGGSSSGLISSSGNDGTGTRVSPPCYLECRLIAQSAPGTWPAFWTSTFKPGGGPNDELDVIEGYGGVGASNPSYAGYYATTHFWNQNGPNGKPLDPAGKKIDMLDLDGECSWSTTFHTYGLKITSTDTIYYLDDAEVFRHPTGEISKSHSLGFLINYAIGGSSGWKIDLDRYGNASDMYVDYVRVYQGN